MQGHFSHARLFAVLSTVVHQAPLSIGFPRHEYWNGLSRPSTGDLPKPGIKPASLASPVLADGFFTTSIIGEALLYPCQQSYFCLLTCVCKQLQILLMLNQIQVQFSCSVMSDSASPWIIAHQASSFITDFQSLLKLMSIELVMPSNHLILCCSLLLCFQSFQHQGLF